MTTDTFQTPGPTPGGPVQAAGFHSSLWQRIGFSGWTLATLVIAALVTLPVLAVISRVFVPTDGVWQHLVDTVLAEYLLNLPLIHI